MDIYDLFSKFELDLLPKEWVQTLWKDDFTPAHEFPTEYDMHMENVDIGELMSSASAFIKEWLESDKKSSIHRPSTSLNRSSLNSSVVDSRSWQNLISNNVHHRSLVAMLSIFIFQGKTEKYFEVKRLGLIATDLYFTLLAIPGSQVFHIFNPILYSHAVENLKICNSLVSSLASAKPPAKKRKSRQNDDDFDDDDDDGNESDGEGTLSTPEKSMIIKMLSNLLGNLHYTFKNFQMKGQDDSLLITIQILILITRLERNSSTSLSKSPAQNSISYLSFKSYKILQDLFCPDHGEVQALVKLTMRELMPGLLVFDQKSLKLSSKEALVIKDHSIQFICNLLRTIKDPAFNGVYTLLQHVCIRVPDKADLRAKGVQVIMELLDVIPYSLYSHSVVWIMSLCHNDQVKNRITGLELITKLLYGNERLPTSPLRSITMSQSPQENSEEYDDESTEDSGVALTQQPDFSTIKFLLATIFSRCQDSASSVRAKALSILANLISSNNRNIRHEMESIFVTPYRNAETIEKSNVYEKNFFDFQHFLKNIKTETNSNVDPLPGAKAVISLLELFIQEEKVFVRKSSLQVLANVFLINEKWMSKQLLEVMVANCRDISVSVRKLLVQCLTDLLLRYPNNNLLRNYWVKGVLPLLADQELKSQEKVLEVVENTILENLVPFKQMKTDLHALPWQLLLILTEQNKRKLFLYACHKWSLNNVLRQSLITTIKTHIGTENNIEAWFLLASFSEYLDIKDPHFVLDYFYENVLHSQQVDEYCCQLVTEVMHLSWRQLPTAIQVTLCETLLRHLAQFTIPLPMISRCVDICQLITEAQAESPEKAREHLKQWAGKLISVCEYGLEKTIGPDCPESVADEVRLIQYIFTVGDAAQICPAHLKHSVLLLIQNLLTGADDDQEDSQEKRWRGKVSAGVQAVSVITLAKLCLQREHTAKVLVPLFGSLLSETPHAEIKINAMIALTDMCIKFTSLVEIHLPEMCICLRDKDLKVRENTLALLIQLIQEDYLKLRCPMFFHLLTTLCDQDQLLRDMTSSFIINSLLAKQKNVLVQHFVEGLFHYNAYMGHSTYSKGRPMSARERTVFCLSGANGEASRRLIYRFMLENMMDDHRFKITYRLCTDILAGVAEGDIELSTSGTTLLQDALYVLSSEEIRLAQLRPSSKDADDDDDGAGGEMAQVAEAINNLARKTLVSQVVKKNMIENVVPIFIKLKHKLQQIKSTLVRDLMACLRELMKDYKTEINEILAADKELAAEILHDLQNSVEPEEDEEDGRPSIGSDEVLKKAVMEVVALNEARKSLRSSASPKGTKSQCVSTSPSTSLSNVSPPTNIVVSPTNSSTSQIDNKLSSPSGSSHKSNSPNDSTELRKSISKRRSNRCSTSSTSSNKSHSKKSGRTKKKR